MAHGHEHGSKVLVQAKAHKEAGHATAEDLERGAVGRGAVGGSGCACHAQGAAQQIAESESRIAALKVQKWELLEAINAGKTALHTVNEVLETLDNAEGWSTWDVMGGGLMADLAKYEELDDAQKQIEQLQVELRRFKTELADVEITADLQVAVDSFLKFADFFFDGLFADWAVLDHINQAQSRVENTKSQIKRVLALLKKMREDVDVQIADEKEKQEQLAVETEL